MEQYLGPAKHARREDGLVLKQKGAVKGRPEVDNLF